VLSSGKTVGVEMPSKVFYSFHHSSDEWRASQVQNIGTVERNKLASDKDWDAIKNGGDYAIQSWIDSQLAGCACAIVLIGQNTANRKWIDYEITKAWSDRKGLMGIYIHNLKDSSGNPSSKGENPFDGFTVGVNKKVLSSLVNAYDPPYADSSRVYEYISQNLENWIEKAIETRNSF